MNQPAKPPPSDPSPAVLILKGVLLIIGAFLSADFILGLHFPSGH
jgi:hypothetical protein